jgi:hypothetical protein
MGRIVFTPDCFLVGYRCSPLYRWTGGLTLARIKLESSILWMGHDSNHHHQQPPVSPGDYSSLRSIVSVCAMLVSLYIYARYN